ncbi:MAG: hypothetical protein IMZ53_06680 [Thermoplasmata archaeon]|nr:hypothetical protein [Thermoplasmata archaeon]
MEGEIRVVHNTINKISQTVKLSEIKEFRPKKNKNGQWDAFTQWILSEAINWLVQSGDNFVSIENKK